MGVYIYQSGTEKELQNAYIGEYRVPGINTIAYYPLNSTSTDTDQSGNNNNGTTTGTLTYGSNYCQFSSGNYITIPNIIPYGTNPFTLSIWFNSSDVSGHQNWFYNQFNSNTDNSAIGLFVYNGGLSSWSKGYYDWNDIVSISSNTWYNVIITYEGSILTCYLNGTQVGIQYRTISSTTPDYNWIGCGGEVWGRVYCIAQLSEYIIENKTRTAQEVSAYYNLTKSNYGL